MANRYAIATGNWSDPAIWDGGVSVPTTGDAVRPNNFTVTIDQDITVFELRNDAAAPASGGGTFVISSIPGGGRIINADLRHATTSITVLVNITASSGTLTINGDVYGPTSASGVTSYTVVCSGSVATTTIINGNVIGPTTTTGFTESTITIAGSSNNLIVNGNVTGGSGHSSLGRYGISMTTGSQILIVNGNVTAGTTAAAYGIFTGAGSHSIDIHGSVTATTIANGINTVQMAGAPAILRLRGPLVDGSNGRQAILSSFRILHAAPAISQWTVRDDSGFPSAGAAMVLTNIGVGMPDPSDVAAGVIYGPDDEFIGTMPSDINPADVWGYAIAAADEPNSMGIRLRNNATVETTAAQLASALGE